jgi:methylenetetrahydrofolate dehydrogenase (NADP+) / methenyltetrahydrofolate cyclohydrolase
MLTISTMIIDNKLIKDKSLQELQEKLARIEDPLTLDIVLSTQDPASAKYVSKKQELGSSLGVTVNIHKSYTTIDLSKSNGVIIQLPCSAEEEKYLSSIPLHLDVDLFSASDELAPYGIFPPTIKGILQVLDNPTDLRGKNVVVIGQGKLVGKPMVDALIELEATIISCNEHTHNIKEFTRNAFIVISGTGVGNLIDDSWVNPSKPQFWIDAGTSGHNGVIIGDINKVVGDYSNIKLCPSPRGIGPLTVINIFHNLVDMYVLKSILTNVN